MASKCRWQKLCAWFGVPRRTVYYKPTKAAPKVDPRFAEPIKAIIKENPSFGYLLSVPDLVPEVLGSVSHGAGRRYGELIDCGAVWHPQQLVGAAVLASCWLPTHEIHRC
jgi:hypothetical protein